MTSRVPVSAMMGLAATVFVAAMLPRTGAAQPEGSEREGAKPLIVMIGHPDCGGVIGAGIVVGLGSDRLYIATADHLVRCKGRRLDSVDVRFRFLPGERIAGKVLDDVDRRLDLTVLSVVGLGRLAIPVKKIPFGLLGDTKKLSFGDEVFMIGNPAGRRWRDQARAALVTQVAEDRLEFETTLAQQGHSGGGLFNDRWELVGMIVEDEPPTPRAVPIDRVLRRLRQWGYPVALKPKPVVQIGPAASTSLKADDTFRDCPACPEMVVVPAGSFLMGSPEAEDGRKANEGPQHRVRIGEPFAVGRFEVTRDQFDIFVRQTGHSVGSSCWTFENGKYKERPGRPYRITGFSESGVYAVVCVNWDDAKAYADWLAGKTGQRYRLLSEAEWEYVARAGSTSRFSFGDRDSELCRHGNGADKSTNISRRNQSCNDGYTETAPIGSFSPNRFGLHDMHGNVWEWTEDCWNDRYSNALNNGAARTGGDCSRRVLRGGGWNDAPKGLRSANRGRISSDRRYDSGGFRIARTLTP